MTNPHAQIPTPLASPTPPAASPDRALVPGPVGGVLARAYAVAINHRNRRFDAGHRVITLDRPVISVGNLSLGGTGKTPMVQRVVAHLREHGHDPAIAMRGYRSSPDGLSDEAELYKATFDNLPLVAQPRRVEGLIKLFATQRGESVDCIVLDDGFQHRRIARQLDLVLIDAAHDPFEARVLPAGRLREPAASLARATHVVLTHAESVDAPRAEALAARAATAAGVASCAVTAHEWVGLTVHARTGRPEPVSFLAGKRVIAVCAIGRPGAFLDACRGAGATIVEPIVLRDHDPFAAATISRIQQAATNAGADAIVLTAKDWTKLGPRKIDWPVPVCVPDLALHFREGWDALAADLLAVVATRPD
ncbi:MAG: tetraacyldisaccharide 4'-kinase [Planctomycetota bacterium]|nr:tetraacyldisaccharide 4'-kinase [Planctomycetota bacterium]